MRLQTSLSQEDQRSWRLNEEALAAAATDWPRAASKIRDNLDRLEASGAASPALIGRYRQLVDRGPDVLRAELFALTCQGNRFDRCTRLLVFSSRSADMQSSERRAHTLG